MRQSWLTQVPRNMHYPREYYFRDLRELDVENLMCGRITRQTMDLVRLRVDAYLARVPYHDENMLIADELNDLLRAARPDGE